jgi:hypothetical protein
MAFQVLRNCKVYWDGYDLTGASNKATLKYSADILDDTVFGATSKSRVCGLKSVELDLGGFWEAGAGKIDTLANGNLALAGKIISLGPTEASQGEPFFSFQSILGEYQAGAAVGELLPFDFKAQGSDQHGLLRGLIIENSAKTSTAAGAARHLGAVGATQHLYAVLHILAVSGTNPKLDLVIQSDDSVGFSSPTTRITFAQQTAVGAVWASRVAGAIADTYYRASWTIAGTNNPSFTIFIGLAIQ